MNQDQLDKQAATLFQEMDLIDRESGLRLDRNGRWHHEGVEVTHEGLHRAVTRWLAYDAEAARFIIRVSDDFWAWVDVDDAPFQAHLLTLTEQGLLLRLSDQRELLWDGAEILLGEDNAWYITIGDPPLEARLSRPSLATLAERLEEDPDDEDRLWLTLPGGRTVGFTPRPAPDSAPR